jgi:arylsulfatase A-like enzyme
MNRRQFLATATTAPLFAQRKAAVPPNILLILADDLASWMLGCYGNQEIRTPNIDRLAQSGVRFANSFVCTPICSASRATLFTGRTPAQHGIHDFLTQSPIDDPPQGQFAPPPSFQQEVMLSDVLAARGYRCGYLGKWHMGDDTAPQHKFDYWFTMSGGERQYQNPRMSLNGQVSEHKGYMTDLITQHAHKFLDAQKPGQPFFLTAAYLNPHTPYDGHPQKYYDMYAATNFETIGWEPAAPNALREKNMLRDIVGNLRKCAAATTALDDQIPLLLKKLEERGLRDNTLIVFAGDNGYLLGRHGLWSKGLASDPINMYEEVIRVPMIWQWPGRTPVQTTKIEMVSFYDFMPAICDVAGAAVPSRNLCGRSYLPLATGGALPKKEPWRNVVFGHFRNTEMVRDTRFKLILRNAAKGPNEMFDLRNDPRERVNQYDNPEFLTARDRLAAELQAWRTRYKS